MLSYGTNKWVSKRIVDTDEVSKTLPKYIFDGPDEFIKIRKQKHDLFF
jgi:hypothetical protein